ncbi:ABC transporter permease [Leifsonia sp. TF02-11]|uniref:ABC transporter permease n=1 Tax=Leifsonia sp. TF02-11 TaxID=2815212 RepID=UPI001AA16247|nr:ABC transporter permease [Leifsonia sp. TF02-11]MBO1741681.1 ABC transporter permease [Leifsonia sp. TF02-11]
MTTLAAVTPSRRVSGATSAAVFIGRSVRHSLRNVEALTMAIALPVMLMLLFTFVFGGAIDSGGGYVDYVVPGIILLCAGFGASSTAVDVAEDMSNGIVDRFRTMPLRANGVITGHVVASLLRNLLATGVVVGVALAVGFRPSANVLEWVGALAMVALFILAITWLFAAIGIAAANPTAASGYGFALLFLPYLSSAFVPTDTMPSWLQWIAQNQPITPIIETIRAFLFGRDPGSDLWWALGWCAVIIVGAYVWAAWLFRRKAGRR